MATNLLPIDLLTHIATQLARPERDTLPVIFARLGPRRVQRHLGDCSRLKSRRIDARD